MRYRLFKTEYFLHLCGIFNASSIGNKKPVKYPYMYHLRYQITRYLPVRNSRNTAFCWTNKLNASMLQLLSNNMFVRLYSSL